MHSFDAYVIKVFDEKLSSEHNITGLNSGKIFYHLLHSGEAFSVKGLSTHRHKHTHTHTHTHTYTQACNHARACIHKHIHQISYKNAQHGWKKIIELTT